MDHLSVILALPNAFRIDQVIPHQQHLTIVIHTQTQSGCCPDCQCLSRSIHGYYWRFAQDLPLAHWQLCLQIRVTRFRCTNLACPRYSFAEAMTPLVRRYSRRTQRASQLLTHLGFALGGQAGARVAHLGRLPASRTTLLRLVRRSQLPVPAAVEVVGIDDWAFCRGERYGTILVDLERHQVIDLLPDAEATTLATWLQVQPQVRVIRRDRAGSYAEGARQGAPNALQVADRWHLLRNLWEALALAFDRHTASLRQLVAEIGPPTSPRADPLPAVHPSGRPQAPPTPAEQARAARRQYWEGIFAQVHDLRAHGLSNPAIARHLGVSLGLVKKYSRLETLPKKRSPKFKPLLIAPYLAYLRARLQQSPVSTDRVREELRALGFGGSRSTVYQALVRLRQELHLPSPVLVPKPHPLQTLRASPRELAAWLLTPNLSALKQALLQKARDLHPTLELVSGLAQDFVMLVRQRKPQHLLPWIEAVQLTEVASLKQFAQGILRDFDAVYAACSQPWSNGQVEGQINRLKLLKRQMYGRANFDLLLAGGYRWT